MSTVTQSPITYGDEVVADSISDFVTLGKRGNTRWLELSPLVVSRDGSRRIIRAGRATLVNTTLFPAYATNPLNSHSNSSNLQRWDGVRLVALSLPRVSGQKVLLWNAGVHRTGAPQNKSMVGLYVPYVGSPTTELSETPVNHIPALDAVKSELAEVASGWDLFWHSRFVFQNHLRQQVISRLVDGILAYGWAEIAKVAAAARPAQTSTWRTEAVLIASLVRMAIGPLTGDPALWSRVLSRNIDVNAFRARLDKGQIPGVDTRATPDWGPTAETLISTTPVGDVNEKKVAIAAWHEANQRNTEDVILKYHDSELQRPVELTFGYDDSHEHEGG